MTTFDLKTHTLYEIFFNLKSFKSFGLFNFLVQLRIFKVGRGGQASGGMSLKSLTRVEGLHTIQEDEGIGKLRVVMLFFFFFFFFFFLM